MQELVHCVESGKEFTLSRDHHDCPFGQWHDQFQTQNILLKSEVEKMGPPHKAIHRLADEALFIRDKEGVEGALTYIERNKTLTLDKLLFLFQRTKDLLLESKRSIAILMSVDKEVALLVDRVENFIPLGGKRLHQKKYQRIAFRQKTRPGTGVPHPYRGLGA